MIEGLPLDFLGAPSIFGQPYHGLATAETREGVFGWWVALPNGQYKLLDTVTPPSQTAIVPGSLPGLGQFRIGAKRIEIPGVPPVVRNEMQAAEDLEAGREWRTVAMYGDVASLGVSIGNLWADSTGARWRVLVSSAQVDQDFAGTISISVSVRRFGAFGRPDTNETKTKVFTMAALGQTGPADGWLRTGHVIRMNAVGETSRDGSRQMVNFTVDHAFIEQDAAFVRAASWHVDAATPINRFASCQPAICGVIEVVLSGSPDLPGGWDFSINVLKTRDEAMGAYSFTNSRTGTLLGDRRIKFSLEMSFDVPMEGPLSYYVQRYVPRGPDGMNEIEGGPVPDIIISDELWVINNTVSGAVVGMYYDPDTDDPIAVTSDVVLQSTFDASWDGAYTGYKTVRTEKATGARTLLENTLTLDASALRIYEVLQKWTIKRAGIIVDEFELRQRQERTNEVSGEDTADQTIITSTSSINNFSKSGPLETITTGAEGYDEQVTQKTINIDDTSRARFRVYGPIWSGEFDPRWGSPGNPPPPPGSNGAGWRTEWIVYVGRQSRTSWRILAGTKHTYGPTPSLFHAGQLIYPGGLMPGYAAAPITALPPINVAYNPVTGECVQRDRPVCWV